MIFIIGGAYQGKLEFARSALGVNPEQVFTCTGRELDFSKPCVYGLEEYCYACVLAGVEPAEEFARYRDQWKDSILICQDLSSGVVPMGAELRQWRNATGRLCQYLAGQADRVSRIFCGLEQRLK